MKLLAKNITKHYKITLLMFSVISLTVVLGIWQVSRAYEKESLQNSFIKKSDGDPVDFEKIVKEAANKQEKDINYQHVKLTGQYIKNKHLLLDNQIVNGKPGFNVISAFVTKANQLILVDRGWLGPIINRDKIPEIPETTQQLELTGLLFNQLPKPFLLAKESLSTDWPKIIQALDKKQLKSIFNLKDFYLLRLHIPQAGAFIPHYKPINITPEKHWGYAIQWFSIAFIIFVLFMRFILKNINEAKELYS
ncbi:SURF1 family protein [Endozoicomonas sp. SM1973]|uniref:SURF1-like protein n=1 Tax=Spartinivicinus marinus TaxID=2994442 RepID=A0A853I1B6_9GAMM|nr:SURF1 family protein [Spartinivicinus marinus]MCX4026704.1 SURF1 family protein [Spartinivicinus marinus]NYZ64538.1 SURF1 family protein [Spartinivicinus marinus]